MAIALGKLACKRITDKLEPRSAFWRKRKEGGHMYKARRNSVKAADVISACLQHMDMSTLGLKGAKSDF